MALITGDNFNNFGVGNPDLLGRLTPDGNSYEWKQDTAFPVTLNTPIDGKAGSVGTTGAKFPEYYIDHDLGTTDYRVKVTCFSLDNDVTNHFTGLRARRIDDNNEISAGLLGGTQGGTRGIVLLQNATNRGFFQFDWLNSTEYEIELECVDSSTPNQISCKVWLNGVLRITSTITDATIYGSNGRAGIRGVHIASTSQYWDNIEVNSLSTVFNPTSSSNLSFSSTGQVHSIFHPSGANNLSLNSFASIAGGIINPQGSTAVSFSSSGKIAGGLFSPQTSANVSFSSSAIIRDVINPTGSANVSFTSTASITFDDFSFKWSVDHIEASASHGFPSVYVQVDNANPITGDFASLVSSGEVFERRLLEMPRLQEVQLDDRSGLAGFQRVTLQADNSDGLLNGLDLQDSFVRMFFVDADGVQYKEFNGKIVDWTLSHTVTINVEDLDALAFTQELPKRTLNDLVEAEKAILDTPGTQTELTEFTNSVVADDLGKPIPIIFGRAVKVPLLYVKADETLVMGESKREYDYIIGEGVGLNSNNFEEVFTVYRDERTLGDIQGEVQGGDLNTVILEAADNNPNNFYQYWWLELYDDSVFTDLVDTQFVKSSTESSTAPSVELDSNLILGSSSSPWYYRLREYRFYDGSQASPYAGYSFIRSKKRFGTSSSTDKLYADVNGLQDEVNRARAIESILNNSTWGLGLSVDSTSFGTAASAMTAISSFTCEGAILSKSLATDIFAKLLSFRDMILSKDDSVEISVDSTKSSSFNFGLGDETGYNNILDQSPAINYNHPDQKVKNLKVRYRKNQKESDSYLHEFTRSSSANGVDDELILPFVYDHTTADKALDYKRKRLADSVQTLSLTTGEDGKRAKRGDLVTVDIPSLGINSNWEVQSTNVTMAGSNNLNLVPYSASPYTYTAFTSEGGTLPVDEDFDIAPDYTNSAPFPVTSVSVSMLQDVVAITIFPYAKLTWTPPEDNYGGAVVSIKLHSEGSSEWRDIGTFDTSARVESLIPGQLYDFRITSLNITGEHKGLAVIDDDSGSGHLAGGDTTDPNDPSALTGDAKFGTLIWTFTKSTSTDVKFHKYRIYTASTGGTLLKSGRIWEDDEPEFTLQRQTGDLTSSLSAWAEIEAVDHTGNTSNVVGRVQATTGDITRPDIEDDTTQVHEETFGSGAAPASITGSGGSGVPTSWHDVISDSITLDSTARVKVRFSGQWEDSGSGFYMRLRRDTTTLWTSAEITSASNQIMAFIYSDTTTFGSKTYTVQIGNNTQGGGGLGLTDRSLSLQVDYK